MNAMTMSGCVAELGRKRDLHASCLTHITYEWSVPFIKFVSGLDVGSFAMERVVELKNARSRMGCRNSQMLALAKKKKAVAIGNSNKQWQ